MCIQLKPWRAYPEYTTVYHKVRQVVQVLPIVDGFIKPSWPPCRYPTVLTQGSFALETLPSFLATTSPCADPDASHHHFGLFLIGGVLAACAIHSWSSGPSRLSVCSSFLECCAPFAGGSSGALDQFFPDDFGLRQDIKGSTTTVSHKRIRVGGDFDNAGIPLCCGPPVCLPFCPSGTVSTAPKGVST